jgi:benzylsuccinate CoA-transferase BbsF subunit
MKKDALKGVKVADLSWAAVGPIIGRTLAYHGATVVRVESSTRLDIIRLQTPYKDNIPGLDRSGNYASYNAGKYGMALNLSHPDSGAVKKRIVEWADIILSSFRPGVMEKLGLDYDSLKAINPGIIALATSIQGNTGPHRSFASLGTHLVALSGLTYVTGWPDRVPSQPFGAYTDFIAPHFGCLAVLGALIHRGKTGQGQYIELSQYETALQFLSPLILDAAANKRVAERCGNKCEYAVPHGVYPCKGDDRWCAIAAFDDEQWKALCKVIGASDCIGDERFATFPDRKKHEEAVDNRIAQWSVLHPAEEVYRKLQRARVPSAIVNNARDLHADEKLRDFFVKLEHPEMGLFHYEAAGFKLSDTPFRVTRPSPLLGEHTEYVCKKVLGMSGQEYREFKEKGVLQ